MGPSVDPHALAEGDRATASDEILELELRPDEEGERLDRVLAARELGHSRNVLARWLDEGRVTIGGEPASRKTKARAGQVVRIEPAPPPPSQALPEAIPLAILYEDPHLIVIDKAAGMVVHPAPGHVDGTLVNALLHHAETLGGPDPRRPGIVHRLDKDTSGVMVVAKTPEAHQRLVEMFQAHDLDRRYRAIVRGATPATITYDTLHGRHPHDRKRFSSRVTRGRRAITHVRMLTTLHEASEIECNLETGRTHQIRMHLAEHGHALLGDPLYSSPPKDSRLRMAAEALGRQALHAAILAFRHPMSGEFLRFETEPPEDYRRALEALRDSRA